MLIQRLFIPLMLVSQLAFGQSSRIKATDKYVSLINGELKEQLLQKHTSKNSVLGGTVTMYYLHKKLVLISSHYGGEFGYIAHSFYFENDSMIFANEKKIILKEPESEKEYAAYEKYVIFNTDKYGNTDLTKWPLTVNISNDYYFNKDKVIKYQLKSFDKPVKTTEAEIETAEKDLIYRYTTHLEELKTP